MTAKLQGKVAIVTGAGNGIGRATAEKLLAEGAVVALCDIDELACRNLASSFGAHSTITLCGDITDLRAPQLIIDRTIETFGDLHIIVNNAGYPLSCAVDSTTDDGWARMLDIHATAPFRLLREAAPHLRRLTAVERSSGKPVARKIVNVSSLAATCGAVNLSAYGAAKAAVIGLTKALCKEWGPLGVNVNSVVFGHIETRLSQSLSDFAGATIQIGDLAVPVGIPDTVVRGIHDLTPLGRSGTVNEAAGAIALLCYPESDFITGEVITCSGGLAF